MITIKDSFLFAKEVLEFGASLFLASFDIKSLFTNIPLTEMLNLCILSFYRNQTHVANLTKISIDNLLNMTVFESFFILAGKFCKQCDDLDDLNKLRENINFTLEIEENGLLSFLDIKISRENNKFVSSVYRSGVFTNLKVLHQTCTNARKLKFCFIEVLDYAPSMRTLFRKMRLWSQYSKK